MAWKNGKSIVSMYIRITAEAQTSIFEKSSVSGNEVLSNCSGAMNYFVPERKLFKIYGTLLKLSLSNGVEYEKSITMAAARSSESMTFQGFKSR